ncbi:flavin reductase family protein [Candidatus Zixiibacteriota bacterium]
MIIDPAGLNPREAHRLLISLIIPRPIAWVTSISPDGIVNAAPYSFFSGVRSLPPVVSVSAGYGINGEKDTPRNISATGEFVINLVSSEQAEEMNRTATEYPYGVSETDELGIELVPSETISVPRIAASPAALECVLEQIIPVGDPPASLILGEVKAYRLREGLEWDRVEGVAPETLDVIGRLNLDRYMHITDTFSMKRIRYEAPGE